MSKKKNLVYFNIDLKKGVDAKLIKTRLEKLSGGLEISILDLKDAGIIFISGQANQKTYESVFNAQLEYKTRNILSGGRYRNVSYWEEKKPAEVPNGLEDLIYKVNLSVPKIPCKR